MEELDLGPDPPLGMMWVNDRLVPLEEVVTMGLDSAGYWRCLFRDKPELAAAAWGRHLRSLKERELMEAEISSVKEEMRAKYACQWQEKLVAYKATQK